MRRKTVAPGSPEDWLARAKSNLALARQPKPEDSLWEDQCFQAQQAAEKALKAVYQSRALVFQYVHDIGKLGNGLEKNGIRIPPEVREAFDLTSYALETRYPGPLEPVTEREYRRALVLAGAVVSWAEKIISSRDVSESPAVYKASPKAKKRKKK